MQASDTKLINDVIDRLKKQGLFDKFRKECMADVDTKPAYQNLTVRVQGAVEQFLSSQKWSPDLNKNQLRESLRRHLNELPMLSMGVDRVVEQVVSPKIYKDFKPQIDRVICEILDIDYEEWLARQNAYKQWTQRQTAAPPANIPCLLDIAVQGPVHPPVYNANIQHPTDVAPPVLPNMHGPPPLPPVRPLPPPQIQAGPLHPNVGVGPPRGLPGPANIRMPPPRIPHPDMCAPPPSMGSGVPPPPPPVGPHFAGVRLPPPGCMLPNDRLPIPPHPGHINVTEMPPRIISDTPNLQFPQLPDGSRLGMPFEFSNPQQAGFYQTYRESPSAFQSQAAQQFPAGAMPNGSFAYGLGSEPGSQFVLPPLPEPDVNPPLPEHDEDRPPLPEDETDQPKMTKTARDREARKRRKERKLMEEQMLTSESIIEQNSQDAIIDSTASCLPEASSAEIELVAVNSTDQLTVESNELQVEGSVETECVIELGSGEVYIINESEEPAKEYHFAWENDEEECLSDVTVSSVHTSDLSSFDEDIEHGVNEDSHDAMEGAEVVSAELELIDSDQQQLADQTEDVTSQSETGLQQTTPKRQSRKPFYLQNYYSDSDNEETREQRRARMAVEKEQRYLRRQQRRMELELKRKERDTEKTESTSGRKKSSLSERAMVSHKKATVKEQEVNMELTEKVPPAEDSIIPDAVPIMDVPVDVPENVDEVTSCEVDLQISHTMTVDTEVAPPPSRGRRTKSQMKQELHDLKVQEKQRELRRQRTRNRKYMSQDFTSIFTENRELLASSGYVDSEKKDIVGGADFVQEEIVESGVEQSVEIDYGGNVVAECVEVGSSSSSDDEKSQHDASSRPRSPYSEISNSTVYSISSDSEQSSAEDMDVDSDAKESDRNRGGSRHRSTAVRQPEKQSKVPSSSRHGDPEKQQIRRGSPHVKHRSASSKMRESNSGGAGRPHGSINSREESSYLTARQKDDQPQGAARYPDVSFDSAAGRPRDDSAYGRSRSKRHKLHSRGLEKHELYSGGEGMPHEGSGPRLQGYYDIRGKIDSNSSSQLQHEVPYELVRRREDDKCVRELSESSRHKSKSSRESHRRHKHRKHKGRRHHEIMPTTLVDASVEYPMSLSPKQLASGDHLKVYHRSRRHRYAEAVTDTGTDRIQGVPNHYGVQSSANQQNAAEPMNREHSSADSDSCRSSASPTRNAAAVMSGIVRATSPPALMQTNSPTTEPAVGAISVDSQQIRLPSGLSQRLRARSESSAGASDSEDSPRSVSPTELYGGHCYPSSPSASENAQKSVLRSSKPLSSRHGQDLVKYSPVSSQRSRKHLHIDPAPAATIRNPLPAPSSVSRDTAEWRLPPPPVVPVSDFHSDIVLWPAPSPAVGLPVPFVSSAVSTPLMAPPKACRARSPDPDRTRSRDRPVRAVWDVPSEFPEKISGSVRSSHGSPAVSGYSQLPGQDVATGSSSGRDTLRQRRAVPGADLSDVVAGVDSVIQTRASSRRTELENAPVAKRLRH